MLADRLHVPASNDAVDVTSLWRRCGRGGGAVRRLQVGLEAVPGTAARPEAGNSGEGFARLFQACAVLPHQACAGGSVFSCRRLSKAGLAGSATGDGERVAILLNV